MPSIYFAVDSHKKFQLNFKITLNSDFRTSFLLTLQRKKKTDENIFQLQMQPVSGLFYITAPIQLRNLERFACISSNNNPYSIIAHCKTKRWPRERYCDISRPQACSMPFVFNLRAHAAVADYIQGEQTDRQTYMQAGKQIHAPQQLRQDVCDVSSGGKRIAYTPRT